MERYTVKQLKGLISAGAAIDITRADHEECNRIKSEAGYIQRVGYVPGTNGLTGLLFYGEGSGKLYAITKRSGALFSFGQ